MNRDQFIKEVIFDKLMRMTETENDKDSVRRLRVSILLQTLNFWLTHIQIYKNLYCRKITKKEA